MNAVKIVKRLLVLLSIPCIMLFDINYLAAQCIPPGGNQKGGHGSPGDPNNKSPYVNYTDAIVTVLVPKDPNDINGPTGYEQKKWMSVSDRLSYTIRFENDPKLATAPAHNVFVRLPILHPFNINSFRLGRFGFGKYSFQAPGNTGFYNTRLDLTDSLGIYVDFIAGIDIIKNEVFWSFRTIDPETGLPPQDPFKGFLKINDSTLRTDSTPGPGEGFLVFDLKTKGDITSGDTTMATAAIIFDTEEAILTNTWNNTIDAFSPTSKITSFVSAGDSINLVWTGSDDINGSGIRDYDLFVSEDSAAFTRYAANLKASGTSFTGTPGRNYRFFVMATDNTGNKEPLKSDAEVTVTLHGCSTEICNGKDDDCDGFIDEGFTKLVYFEDTDGDGYGNSQKNKESCIALPGYVLRSGDCDDNAATIHPEAEEICNGKDDDCDGQVDEGCSTGNSFYFDNDKDGRGDPKKVINAEIPPPGYVTDNTDCNDNDKTIYPGATEICDNKDNDCNGIVDDNLQVKRYYQDSDSDGFGNSLRSLDSCSQPAGYVTDSTDCDDRNAAVFSPVRYYRDNDRDGLGDPNVSTAICSVIPPAGYVDNKKDDNDSVTNRPPVVHLGPDFTITGNSAILSAWSAYDPEGGPITYSWKKIGGPASFEMLYGNSASPVISNLISGIYIIELTVIDKEGAIGRDAVIINVNRPFNNLPPLANAGADTVITQRELILSGDKSSDPEAMPIQFSWRKIQGPSLFKIMNSVSPTPTVNSLVTGIYLFELKVTDNEGASSRDTVQVTVQLPAGNLPPVANAGPDYTMTKSSVTLNPWGSFDPEGGPITYSWKKTAGPASFEMLYGNSASPVLTNLISGEYTIELTVSDKEGATGRDTVVLRISLPVNLVPNAHAGNDSLITERSMILDGSASSDPDGLPLQFLWRKIEGPSLFTIINASSSNPTISSLVTGTYLMELKVTDTQGASGRDTVVIVVKLPAGNLPPVANAGPDLTITAGSAILSAWGSFDPGGGVISYSWRKIDGPASFEMLYGNSASPIVSDLVTGVYSIELTVKDKEGAIGKDTVIITVNRPVNLPPVADAGADTLITQRTITVNGIYSSDPEGSPLTFSWKKLQGPALFTIINPSSANAILSSLVNGRYQIELKVTDNYGASAKDTLEISVQLPPGNLPPVANAGPDFTLNNSSAILSAWGSFDPDGEQIKYSWRKVAGPDVYSMLYGSSASPLISNLIEGTYTFRLTVKDNQGDSAVDDVTVFVYTIPITGIKERSGTTVGLTEAMDDTSEDEALRIQVFPNPVKQTLNVRWSNGYRGHLVLSIIDVMGKSVKIMTLKKENVVFNNSMDVGSLKPGIYFLHIKLNDGKFALRKFIKD